MRFILALIAILAVVGILAIYLGYIDVNQTQNASLPQVEVKGGQLPAFNASVATVEVGSRNETVQVPTVDVKKPK